MLQWLGLGAFVGECLILRPGQGTKILQAMWHDQKTPQIPAVPVESTSRWGLGPNGPLLSARQRLSSWRLQQAPSNFCLSGMRTTGRESFTLSILDVLPGVKENRRARERRSARPPRGHPQTPCILHPWTLDSFLEIQEQPGASGGSVD